MINYVLLLIPPFTPHLNLFSISARRVHQFGVRLMPFIPISHNHCTVPKPLNTFLWWFDDHMCPYLSQLHDALNDFNELLPPSIYVKELENRSIFFMTLGLYSLAQVYVSTKNQIIGSLVNPTMTFASFELSMFLKIWNKKEHTMSTSENIVFASQSNNLKHFYIWKSKNSSKCKHYWTYNWYMLEVAWETPSFTQDSKTYTTKSLIAPELSINLSWAIYENFINWCAICQSTSNIISVARSLIHLLVLVMTLHMTRDDSAIPLQGYINIAHNLL